MSRKYNVLSLRNTPPGTSFILQDGNHVELLKASVTFGHFISLAARVSLAFTEAALSTRTGRVYHHIAQPSFHYEEERERLDGYVELCAAPDLFYVPEPWTAVIEKSWKDMTGEAKVWMLNSRHGWVSDITPVLPFAVSYLETITKREESFVAKNVLNTAKVTVILGHRIYVVPTQKIRDLCELKFDYHTEDGQPKFLRWVTKQRDGKAAFDEWRIYDGIQGVVRKLGQIHAGHAGDDFADAIWSFRSVHLEAIEAAFKANAVGQPGALLGKAKRYSVDDN